MLKLLLALVAAGFLVETDNPSTNPKVQYRFAPGSKWVAVKGRRGTCTIVEAQLLFKDGKVDICWKAQTGGGFYSCTKTYQYRLDPKSSLPRIMVDYPLWSARGAFRMGPKGPELELEETDFYAPIKEPPGKLWLILEQEK